MVDEFFKASTDNQRRQEIIRQYGVDYVDIGPAERSLGSFAAGNSPFLRPVFTSAQVVVYAVQPN